ncbi:hypothetical protein MML61_22510 [Mycobacterium marinum]|uniref:hypothetical protein n=1 Tax=Mycobacterium marinum TaxID=1781 RepID=UPI002359EA47|nr:hypothetical protein [Mycobacterium marinum]WCS17539.1 hypothetical protein MML61_22510 [Mycobacterium marinum]
MATFRINGDEMTEKSVEAAEFEEDGLYTIFRSEIGVKVFAIPTSRVNSIERVDK